MAEKQLKVWQATTTFVLGGHGHQTVYVGDTVADGHPLLKGRKHLFKPFTPKFPLPAAAPEPAAEPEPAPAAEPEAAQ
jgi:hypothetical protein